MACSVLTSADPQTDSSINTAPYWGAWSGFLIVGCFYLTQAFGLFIVQIVATLGMGISPAVDGAPALDQSWLLPVSLLAATIGGALVSWQVATRRAKPSMNVNWFWEFLGKSYGTASLWRFVLLGVSLGLGFFALTEYGVRPPDDLPQPLFDAMVAAPFFLKIGWAFMFIVLFPAVEETLFRGFLFTGLAQSCGPIIASLVTTVLFVAVHMPKVLEYWPALVAVIFIGALTVMLRLRTGSLAPGITMHSTYNGTLVAAAFLTQTSS